MDKPVPFLAIWPSGHLPLQYRLKRSGHFWPRWTRIWPLAIFGQDPACRLGYNYACRTRAIMKILTRPPHGSCIFRRLNARTRVPGSSHQGAARPFPGCVILKNDPNYKQGVPDLILLWEDRWAMLEVKASGRARHRPNQDYYVDVLDRMSFAAFISPDNKEHVLDALQRSLTSDRRSRISQRE